MRKLCLSLPPSFPPSIPPSLPPSLSSRSHSHTPSRLVPAAGNMSDWRIGAVMRRGGTPARRPLRFGKDRRDIYSHCPDGHRQSPPAPFFSAARFRGEREFTLFFLVFLAKKWTKNKTKIQTYAPGFIMAEASAMRVTLDLSSRLFIPLPRFIRSRRPTPLQSPSLVLFPPRSD